MGMVEGDTALVTFEDWRYVGNVGRRRDVDGCKAFG